MNSPNPFAALKTSDRNLIGADIARRFDHLRRRMTSEITPPAGHCWRESRDELTWFLKDAVQSTQYGASLHINRPEQQDDDISEFEIEIRWFWKAPDFAPNALKFERSQERAILFVRKGKPIWSMNVDLLTDQNRFPKADNLDALVDEIVSTLNTAIAD